ncbi:SRP9-domain-containing protein [Martensiomyces pterosporus]|nr:SRP9-domain-containing protein [Martensiomyces pterosporus]
MVFYDSWETFEKAATDLYASAASRARYTVKYRNCDAELVLKVTDDSTCVQLRTEKLEDIRKMAHLHRILAQTASHRATAVKELSPILPASTRKEDPAATKKATKTGEQATAGHSKKRTRGKKRGN